MQISEGVIHSKYFQSSKNIIFFFKIGFCRVHGKIARYLKTMNKKQEKNDQQNFIQGSDKFAFKKQNTNEFLACTEPTQYNLASFGRNSISSTNRKIAQL